MSLRATVYESRFGPLRKRNSEHRSAIPNVDDVKRNPTIYYTIGLSYKGKDDGKNKKENKEGEVKASKD